MLSWHIPPLWSNAGRETRPFVQVECEALWGLVDVLRFFGHGLSAQEDFRGRKETPMKKDASQGVSSWGACYAVARQSDRWVGSSSSFSPVNRFADRRLSHLAMPPRR